jgi:dGTP triphosphohydrolase
VDRHADSLGYKKHKFGCYQSELPLLEQIAHKLGLPQLEDQRWARHPLVYLMEAADDICYALIDLEDGLEMDCWSTPKSSRCCSTWWATTCRKPIASSARRIRVDANWRSCAARPSST